MFFIISKLLAFLVTPAIWVMALLLFAVFSKDERRRRKRLIWTTVVFYVFCNSFVFDECMRYWEVPGFDENSITEPYDAGIVLGGVITYDKKIERFQFQRQGDRIIQAIILYKKGKIKKIVFSGGAGALSKPEDKEGPHVKAFLLEMGIPEPDILIEGESRNTRQNAMLTKVLLDKNFHNGSPSGRIRPSADRYLLITTSTHERRAVKCFEKAGVPVTPYSVDRFGGPRKFEFDYCFIPNAHTLYNWEYLTHEVVGYIIYKLMEYI